MYDPAGFGGQVIDLGSGWKARIDPSNPDMNLQRHVHVYKDGDEWAQNDDGSPHDQGTTNSGEPPNSVKKKLKEKTGWDWDKKAKDYKDKKEAEKKAKEQKAKDNAKKASIGAAIVGFVVWAGKSVWDAWNAAGRPIFVP